MVDIEKVIKGLENCSTTDGNCQWTEHPDCPYLEDCKTKKYSALDRDALELLKEYKRQDGCPCTHCMKWECDEVCEEYKKWKDT